MSAVFDTLKFVKGAQQNGFTQEQAEFQAKEFYNLIQYHAATKHDIESLRNDVLMEIKSLEQRLIIRLGGIMVTCTGILGFILKH